MGADMMAKVNSAKVLVVGAGGIGCELLKNLVLTGFQDLEVVDLDTIDVSNLNRQFLFRPHHVGKSKAEVARNAAMNFNPSARIIAHHANIKDASFGSSFFSKFALVLNALDNVSARRHVNRLCLACGIPLVEAGTQGYLGQAFPIQRGVTECFECTPKPTPVKFAMCTIRSTPDRPVHCIVWAKELFKLLVGDASASYLYEADLASDAGVQESVYMHVVKAAPVPGVKSVEAVTAWAEALFQAVFHDEMVKRLEMSTYKSMASPPVPVSLQAVREGRVGAETAAPSTGQRTGLKEQQRLSLKEYVDLFMATLVRMYMDASLAPQVGALEFSKDSPLDLDFVTAASNIRAYTFHIGMSSAWEVKSIAGNIIPAIATTNAICAGLEVLEALKILRGDDIAVTGRYTNVVRLPVGRGQLLLAARPAPPNKECYVCGSSMVTVFLDTRATTLRDFIDKVLKGALGFNLPNIDNGSGFNFLEEREAGESDEEFARKMAFLTVPLAELVGGGLQDGSTAEVEDFSQDLCVRVGIVHRDRADFDELKHPQFFEMTGASRAAEVAKTLDAEKAAAAAKAAEASTASGAAGSTAVTAGQKRRREEDAGTEGADGVISLDSGDERDVRRPRLDASAAAATTGDDDVVVLDD